MGCIEEGYQLWQYTAGIPDPAVDIDAVDLIIFPQYTAGAVLVFVDGELSTFATDSYTISQSVGGTQLIFLDADFGSFLAQSFVIGQIHVLIFVDGNTSLLESQPFSIMEDNGMAVTSAAAGGVYRLTAANDTIATKLMIRKIRWVGQTTAGHAMELRCSPFGANDVVVADVCAAANEVKEINFVDKPLRVDQIRLQTLGSGVVYIYIE